MSLERGIVWTFTSILSRTLSNSHIIALVVPVGIRLSHDSLSLAAGLTRGLTLALNPAVLTLAIPRGTLCACLETANNLALLYRVPRDISRYAYHVSVCVVICQRSVPQCACRLSRNQLPKQGHISLCQRVRVLSTPGEGLQHISRRTNRVF